MNALPAYPLSGHESCDGRHFKGSGSVTGMCSEWGAVYRVRNAATQRRRQARLRAGNATTPHRTWHRPDYNDGGARAGSFGGGHRDDPHRRYWEALRSRDLIEPFDDIKLADVKPRDLLGTTACMRLAADTEGRDAGRILVPAPIDQDLVDAAWGLHGVLVLVVPA